MRRPSWAAILAPTVALALVTMAAVGVAHNPALTVYPPAELAGGLLVLGEEGTAALLDQDGTPRWETDVDAHTVQAPVSAHGHAVTLTRSLDTLVPHVQAFEAEGPSWRVPVGPAEALGFVLPTEDGFLAITMDGDATWLSPDGQVVDQGELPVAPWLTPEPLPGGGWVTAERQGTVVALDAQGQETARTELGLRPSDVTVHGDRVLVAVGNLTARQAGVVALDLSLDPAWQLTVPGIRVGGELAVGDAALAWGTFHPEGARLALADMNGTLVWERAVDNATAAAATLDGQRVLAATNPAIVGYDADGEQRWSTQAKARLVSPVLLGGVLYPSGADDQLLAIDPATGELLWTYSDGVDQVPWTDEGLTPRAPAEQEDQAPGLTPLVTAVAASLAAVVLRGRD